ncbi:Endo-1,4-beta-xylanase, GH35 family [Haloplanus vescus]|uniref:endo-1,4-beta-xylanase n=1 Tax=Haloplanus vescus TaxID=555874 RepID=A0A1H3VP78_9EURY|nr:endo-1,4-beta-xylanase [Haloplanus vescus]SDZ76586.1 Endo-1,4-beta-xylanase, GH35 family [Haloplanus vescus]
MTDRLDGRVARRSVLATLAGALAGCSSDDDPPSATPATTTSDETASTTPTSADTPSFVGGERAAWERAADRRIDDHRRADLAITVYRDGSPVPDATVDLVLRDHEFDFSTAYNVRRHFDVPSGHPYRTYVGDLFNEVVFENAHKWRRWVQPGTHERADTIVEFLRDRGLRISGAPVIWQHPEADVLPDDVWAAVEADDEARLRELVRDHVRTVLGHYVDDHGVTEWVFLNEQLDHNVITDALSDADPWESPPLRDWFAVAGEVAPEATLSVNEYDILALDRPQHRDHYASLVEYLLADDAPLDEIAFQGHTRGESERISADEQWRRLERFAGLGDIDLVVSEFDTPGFDSDTAAGAYLYRFLKILYSHPDAAGFRLWGFWDEQHWRKDAPLFYPDWTPKPGYHAYVTLVFDQWFTDETGTTDGDGEYRTRADLGTYDITVTVDGDQRHVTRSLTDADGETTWTIRL